jgi:DNA recombination protein RmuC
MNINFILVVFLLVFGVVAGGFFMWVMFKRKQEKEAPGDNSFLLIQNQLNDLSRTMQERLGEFQNITHDVVRSQFQESQKLIKDVNEQLYNQIREVTKGVTQVGESSKQVFTVAEQLKNLEKTLKHQKQRGNLGEASLELILSNILPPTSYKIQYQFPDGETVDAAIFTKDGIIPVDAKFSLDNYERIVNAIDDSSREQYEKEFKQDLKKRIDETAKYIKPKDGTLPFAFMFIPAEAIYYDLLVNEIGSVRVNTRSLIDYAYTDKHVIIVSPTTFAAYLQSVLYGFRAFKIEESAKQIGKRVEELSRHLNRYEDYYKKLGNSLSTTVNHYNAGYKELGKIDKDVLRITGEATEMEPSAIEKPKMEE